MVHHNFSHSKGWVTQGETNVYWGTITWIKYSRVRSKFFFTNIYCLYNTVKCILDYCAKHTKAKVTREKQSMKKKLSTGLKGSRKVPKSCESWCCFFKFARCHFFPTSGRAALPLLCTHSQARCKCEAVNSWQINNMSSTMLFSSFTQVIYIAYHSNCSQYKKRNI